MAIFSRLPCFPFLLSLSSLFPLFTRDILLILHFHKLYKLLPSIVLYLLLSAQFTLTELIMLNLL